jgi:hypothetical protein
MLKKTAKKIYYITGFAFFSLAGINPAKAQSGIWKDLNSCRQDGDCSLTDFVRLLINVFDFVLGIVGSLALLMFIYGGALFLFSGGNSDQIEKGKKTLTGAAIGLAIIFSSYLIVHFTAEALGIQNASNILNSEQLN